MTDFVTAKSRGLTPLSLFGTKANWRKEAGAYVTQADIDVATYVADVTNKKAEVDAKEYMAWCLYCRAIGATHSQVRIGTGTGQTQVNALNARAVIYPELFRVDSDGKGHKRIVLLVTLPSAPAKPRKATKRTKATKATKRTKATKASAPKASAAAS